MQETQVWSLGGEDPLQKETWRRKWQPTPVFLPGKSHGQRSLVGYSPWGCKELDRTEDSLRLRLSRKLTSSVYACSVVSYFSRSHGLLPARLLCWWDFPSKNTEVGYHFLLQGILPTHGWNLQPRSGTCNPGVEPTSLAIPAFPALTGGFFTTCDLESPFFFCSSETHISWDGSLLPSKTLTPWCAELFKIYRGWWQGPKRFLFSR